jgi:hypothetical protein
MSCASSQPQTLWEKRGGMGANLDGRTELARSRSAR